MGVEFQNCRKSTEARWEFDRQEASRLHRLADTKPVVASKRLPKLPQSRCSSKSSTRASTATSTPTRSRSSTPNPEWRIFNTSILGPRKLANFDLPVEKRATDIPTI